MGGGAQMGGAPPPANVGGGGGGQLSGTVKKWFADKGFGFIEAGDGSGDVFVHFKGVIGDRTELNIGENVTYSLGTNPKTGKVVAENVVGDFTGNPAPGPRYQGGRGGYGGGGRGGYGGGYGGGGFRG